MQLFQILKVHLKTVLADNTNEVKYQLKRVHFYFLTNECTLLKSAQEKYS